MTDRPRFLLSEEARRLVVDGSGRWEHVELWDGDAAQAMILGVPARRSARYEAPVEDEVEAPDPNQGGLFDG